MKKHDPDIWKLIREAGDSLESELRRLRAIEAAARAYVEADSWEGIAASTERFGKLRAALAAKGEA